MKNPAPVVIAAPSTHHDTYRVSLRDGNLGQPRCVSNLAEAEHTLRNEPADLLILDSALDRAFDFVDKSKRAYPRMLILLVDEEADFAFPGRADDITTAPFENHDLLRRSQRLLADRKMETLRADAMPPIREIGQRLRKVSGEIARAEAATAVCLDLKYDYAAVYKLNEGHTALLRVAQAGLDAFQPGAPTTFTDNTAMLDSAVSGQSLLMTANTLHPHPWIADGHLQTGSAVPIGSANRYGVLFAARKDRPVTHQDMLMLELVAAQTAALITKA